jgi:hypothetical protein
MLNFLNLVADIWVDVFGSRFLCYMSLIFSNTNKCVFSFILSLSDCYY